MSRTPARSRLVVTALALALAAGCSSTPDNEDRHAPSEHTVLDVQTGTEGPAVGEGHSVVDPHAGVSLPAAHPAIQHTDEPQVEVTPENAAAQEMTVGGLLVEKPAGWISEPPKNNMRKAQYRLLGADAVDDGTSVVVFYFGGGAGGGGVQANFERWATQFEQADGSSSMEAATLSDKTVNAMPVHLMDLSGRYIAQTAPGSGERVDQSDYRMLAAIIESDHGSYFVKAIGPRETIGAHEAAFHAYIESARSNH